MANEFASVQTNLPPTVSAGWNDPPELPPIQASVTANRLKQMRTTTRPVHPSINDSSCSRYLAYSTPGTPSWTPYANNPSSIMPQPLAPEHQNYMHTYSQNPVPHNMMEQQTYTNSQNTMPNYMDGYGTATWYH